jgi:SNF2 family DNA or RNA helicase
VIYVRGMTLTAEVEISVENPRRILIHSDYRSKDVVKTVPGARWDEPSCERRCWSAPLSWPVALALRAEFGKGLTIGPKLREWAAPVAEVKNQLLALRNQVDGIELPELPGFAVLRPYQRVGARCIALAGQYLLMDETGVGKTRTTLAGLSLIRHEGGTIFPLLVAAPKSMVITWARDEIPRFFPEVEVRTAVGTPTKIRKALEPGADIYVTSWDLLRSYSRLAPFGSVKLDAAEKVDKELQALNLAAVVFDEIHRAKNPPSKRTRAAWAVADRVTASEIRIGTTGTPIQESPEDLFGVLRTVAPDEYPLKTPYVERYLDVDWNEWGGRDVAGLNPTREGEFLRNFQARSRRMTKAVLPDLPEKVYETRWVELPTKLRRAYDSMLKHYIAQLESSTLAAENAMVRAGRLVQLANAAGDIDDEGKFFMTLPSPKVDAFLSDVADGDFDGHQVVVFSDSRQLIDLLSGEMDRKKLDHLTITGMVTGDDRQHAIDMFQAGKVRWLLLTRAGSEGITLTASDLMVRLVRPWSYTVFTQVEDRVHRIGSEGFASVTYVDYITMDSIEETQVIRLNSKEARAQEVLRDSELLSILKAERDRRGL